MPPHRVNANCVNGVANPLDGDQTSITEEQPHMKNILEEDMDPLVQAMIRTF